MLKTALLVCSRIGVCCLLFMVCLFDTSSLFAEKPEQEKKGTEFEEGISEILSAPFGIVVSLGNILVSPSRLPGKAEALYRYPSHVTVITQEEIRASKAKNIPELLRHTEGIYMHDAVGNNQDLTVSLRGFNDGEDLIVLVDGIKVNEPDANNMIFPLIPLGTIERIEIHRGTSSAIYGDGVFSGVVNIITKRAPVDKEAFAESAFEYGSYQSQRYSEFVGGKAGPTDWSFSYVRDLTDGYRSNGGLRGTFIDGKWAISSEDKFLWQILVKNTDESMQNPGALTASEMTEDRRQTENPSDGREMFMTIVSTDLDWNLEELLSLRTNLFYRETSLDFVTTSRTFPTTSGTDELITDTFQRGVVVELSRDQEILGTAHHLVAGTEFTSNLQDDERFDTTNGVRTAITTSRVTDKKTTGVYGQYDFDVTDWCRLNAGLRFDDVSFHFVNELDATANRKNHFSTTSPKVGVVLQPWEERLSLFGNFSRSFKSPNISDLFAFPGVGGSDPNLGPEKGESFEGGVRFNLWERILGALSYFRVNLSDEIRFDGTATSVEFPFGKFTNVAKTRRHGVELSLKGNTLGLDGYFTYAFTDATLRSGDNSGRKLTMVPPNQFTWGASHTYREALTLGFDGFYMDDQYVTGDDANTDSPLEDYLVTNAQLVYKQKDDLEIFFRVNNLFDTLYSTRAVIIGFSEAFATGTRFFNPAPERNATVGIRLRF
ncbi:MAG: TonB-dependent receptor [Candidatus Omnitrophica bacterium]|nr:TonB-dependent receptor [Candidatus Omnitrophota bacterium]